MRAPKLSRSFFWRSSMRSMPHPAKRSLRSRSGSFSHPRPSDSGTEAAMSITYEPA